MPINDEFNTDIHFITGFDYIYGDKTVVFAEYWQGGGLAGFEYPLRDQVWLDGFVQYSTYFRIGIGMRYLIQI